MLAGPADIPRANVLGVGISALTLSSAVEAVLAAVRSRRKGYVCITGVHGVTVAQEEPEFRTVLNQSFLTTPDGMPMVWMARWQGFKNVTRVYGPDLMLEVFRAGEPLGLTHFIYGGGDGVAEALKVNLLRRFPAAKIVGVYTPPFRRLTDAERSALYEEVSRLSPDLFWVGLSTPKQERFMAEHLGKLETTLMLGVGAAFDFHAGRMAQAPRWMQRSGLEWLFRLGCEPRRLWKRYLKNNPLFVARALGQISGIRRYPSP